MDQQGGVSGGAMTYHSPSYYVRMAMFPFDCDKPLYERAWEIIIDYVSRTGERRGAFAEAARQLYPELYGRNPKKAVNRVISLIYYRFRTHISRISRTNDFMADGYDLSMENPEAYDMSYIVSQSRPLPRENRFKKDMELPRPIFEFKKLLHAIMKDIYNDRLYSRYSSLIDILVSDKRVHEILGDKRIWYNGRNYIKIDKESAALLYIILLRIHRQIYGLSTPPRRLITIFITYTKYRLKDIEYELQKLSSKFYDWLLVLD